MIAKKVHYTGRVQGVGFRHTVRQLATGYEVTGCVKNLPDGRVELLALSRDATELAAFLAEIQDHSAVAHYIKEIQETPLDPAPTGIVGFTIAKD